MDPSLPKDPTLSVSDLSVTYSGDNGDTVALASFSADLYPREVFALVGESGSGKSTAGFALGGLLPPENTEIKGRIRVGGNSYNAGDYNSLQGLCGRRIGFVFQEPSSALHPAIRIQTQIAEAIHGKVTSQERRQRIDELLRSVQLDPTRRLLRSYPHHLSGGMQQRVVLAMAIANRPEVLVADEPTTALDPTIRKEILLLIRELASQSDSAVLLITHDFGIVSHFADRVAVLYRGEVVEWGATKEVLQNPQHPYTKELIASAKGDPKSKG